MSKKVFRPFWSYDVLSFVRAGRLLSPAKASLSKLRRAHKRQHITHRALRARGMCFGHRAAAYSS